MNAMTETNLDRATGTKIQAMEIAATMDRLLFWRDKIEAAIGHADCATHSFDDVVGMVVEGKLIPLFFEECFALALVHQFPQAKHYHIFACGGKLQAIIDNTETFKDDAKRRGCDRITISGRKGWIRALKQIGARPTYSVMALDLEV
jgi:hypothetical protein